MPFPLNDFPDLIRWISKEKKKLKLTIVVWPDVKHKRRIKEFLIKYK